MPKLLGVGVCPTFVVKFAVAWFAYAAFIFESSATMVIVTFFIYDFAKGPVLKKCRTVTA